MAILLKLSYRLAFWTSVLMIYTVFSVEFTDFLSGIDIADIDEVNDVLVIYLYIALVALVVGSLVYAAKVMYEIKRQVDLNIEHRRKSDI